MPLIFLVCIAVCLFGIIKRIAATINIVYKCIKSISPPSKPFFICTN